MVKLIPLKLQHKLTSVTGRFLQIGSQMSLKKLSTLVAAIAASGLLLLGQSAPALAAATWPAPAAAISFTFDDGFASVYTQAKPALAKYGLNGTSYVVTDCVGMTKTPNTCRADNDKPYMTWTQIKQLQASGWEIGSHSKTHPYLASSDADDGQPNVLTPAQVEQELSQSKAALAAQGINAMSFASPYGDYNNATLAKIAKYYQTHRGFADTNNNQWPFNDYLLNNFPVQEGVTVDQVKAKIDDAIANKRWLVLTFHNIATSPSTNPDDYEYSTAKLEQIAAYVKSKQSAGLIKNTLVKNGIVKGDTNMFANGGFESGISGGWSTDNTSVFKANNAGNGNATGPNKSVAVTAGPTTAHLYSPKVTVNSAQSYLIKSYLNVAAIKSGEIGYYIDEYDASGNWVSGQWKKAENAAFVEGINFSYTPSSTAVKQAQLQIYVTGNSGIKAFIDGFFMFALNGATPTPVTPTNLVANGTFDAGISGGWSTNSQSTITADQNNNGSPANPVNSVRLTSATQERHLFGPNVAVNSGKSYTIASYLSVKAITAGEIGYYIDEYDASGNWVSGQWKSGISTVGAKELSLQYSPSSTAVAYASLQIIVPANASLNAYIDHIRWYQN
ncbi:MAG TPA: polysaccharide deacetylase family protein [Candidatus Saccharimonadales bacterium]|nr:polysaccharide deacetylase family protein [Candidatus Saccharimonadales bacterium]